MTPERRITSFVGFEIEASRTTRSLTDFLTKFCANFGLEHATYYCRTPLQTNESRELLHTTYPKEWITHYFANDYQFCDPVLVQGQSSLLPFSWDTLDLEAPEARNVFSSALEFGVCGSGLTIPIRGCMNETAMFSICSNTQGEAWSKFLAETLTDLVYSAHLIHYHASHLHGLAHQTKSERLSKREAEVLRWAARGKTAWETARILNLKEKTVSFYISNACAKLQVATKCQAVAKVITEGQIIL